jgi:hypothetical protein
VPVAVDLGAAGAPTATGRTDLGYEEFTRELRLDQMLSRRELRALYEAREAQRAAAAESERAEAERVEAEHEAVLLEPVVEDGSEDLPGDGASGSDTAEPDRVEAEQVEQPTEPSDGERHAVAVPLVEVSSSAHWPAADQDLAISTSSIVLPAASARHHNDVRHALDHTGEIIVTGTIDLPPSLASIGAHPDRYDSVEIDRVIDAADGVDQVESDAAPVRASRAVSTYALTPDVVPAAGSRRLSLPVVLASTGGVLLVGVGTLLVVALGMR